MEAKWVERQRRWGLPIPVFYCEDCGKPVCDDATIEAVSKLFAAEGSNAWYEKEAADILPAGYKCPHCGGVHFTKEEDTLDGWFDSLGRRPEDDGVLAPPAVGIGVNNVLAGKQRPALLHVGQNDGVALIGRHPGVLSFGPRPSGPCPATWPSRSIPGTVTPW